MTAAELRAAAAGLRAQASALAATADRLAHAVPAGALQGPAGRRIGTACDVEAAAVRAAASELDQVAARAILRAYALEVAAAAAAVPGTAA